MGLVLSENDKKEIDPMFKSVCFVVYNWEEKNVHVF